MFEKISPLKWLRLVAGASRSSRRRPRRPIAARKNHFHPLLEQLADRLMPSTVTWTGAADNSWSNGMNWSGGSPPAPTDVAEFTQAAALRTVANVDTAVTVAGLVMDWGGAVNVDNPLTVGDSNLSFALGTFGGNGAISIRGAASTWTGGVIIVGTGGMTNSGTITIDTGALGVEGGGTWTNSGTINAAGAFALEGGSTLSNSGTVNFLTDASISKSNGGTLINTGIVEKTGGTGTSLIDADFINTGGTIDADTGTIGIRGTGSSLVNGAAMDAAPGSTINLADGAPVNYQGTITGTGGGTIALNSGSVVIAGGNATFNMTSSKLFQWTAGGTIDVSSGALTNARASTLNLMPTSGNSPVVLTGAKGLVNLGTMIETGGDKLFLENGTTLTNEKTFNIQSDGAVALSGGSTFINTGTLEKTKGTGISLIFPDATGSGTLSNTGTVTVTSGTLDIRAPVTQISGSTLTAGKWNVTGTSRVSATLTISSSGTLTTIGTGASVTLTGPTAHAVFTQLSGLTTLGGSLSLQKGQIFTTTGDFSNSGGKLTVGAECILAVTGSYSDTSTATVTFQLGGTNSVPTFGQITSGASGTVTLASTLKVTSTVTPAIGTSFEIINNQGAGAVSGTFAGLPEGATFTVGTMTFEISYVGGTGNDVVIKRTA
jgi:hypothetical protein